MARSEEVAKGSRSANGKKPKGKPKSGEFRFININVTEDMKRRVAAWAEGETDVWRYVEELVGQGYRVGVAYDGYNDCYSASLTNKSGPSDYRNACITLRGATGWDALVRLVGIHYAVAGENWTTFEEPVSPDDLW